MLEKDEWTSRVSNPFAAIYQAAKAHNVERAVVDRALLKVAEWDTIDPESFFDDLLQEIAGSTNIVVSYHLNSNQYSASHLGDLDR